MPTLVRLRSLFLPASIGLLVLVAAGWYNLVWLPSEHKYLDDRNFRLLSTISEEISVSVNTFDRMMDNAADSGIHGNVDNNDSSLEHYLKTSGASAGECESRRSGSAWQRFCRPAGHNGPRG
jgi:hypothetical protein